MCSVKLERCTRAMRRVCALMSLAILSACGGQGSGAAKAAISAREAVLIALPEAETQIGDDIAPRDERPQFEMRVAAFALDRTPVTVKQFSRFVEETGYKTDAERLGGGAVFVRGIGQWADEAGADWRHPAGPDEA